METVQRVLRGSPKKNKKIPAATLSASEEIAARFGLEAVPESVRHLNRLLQKCDARSTDEFARLVKLDGELTARLLRRANPRAVSEEDYSIKTVEEALQHSGLNCALLLAMSDPLVRAVKKTFSTLLRIELRNLPPPSLDPFYCEHVLGEVRLFGQASGLVHLRLPEEFLPRLGDRLLGLSPRAMQDEATADDVIGELTNVIAGNFKSHLGDAGLACSLHPPGVRRITEFELVSVAGASAERHGFHAKEVRFYVDISVNPWSQSARA